MIIIRSMKCSLTKIIRSKKSNLKIKIIYKITLRKKKEKIFHNFRLIIRKSQ